MGVSGLYHKKDLEFIESISPKINKAVIVGAGLIGVELAEMLHYRNINVSFLVRESGFWNNILQKEESEIINKEIRKQGIDLRLNTELKEIVGSESVEAIITSNDERIDAQFVGLTAGVSPNIDFLVDSGISLAKGVCVNKYLETNISGIYAIGDCAEITDPVPGHKSIEAAWYTGRMMGETLALTLSGIKTAYKPGPWFNSAKFFSIEYQVYGKISTSEKEDEKHIYKEDKSGKRALRIAYNPKDNQFLGIQSLGIRLRHNIFDTLLRNNAKLDELLKVIKTANFDPEFQSIMK